MWSVKCRVWSLKCKLWSLMCKLWSVECGASPIDTATPQENQRLETRHVGAKKRAFPTRLPSKSSNLIFSTRYQTGWNVTKCHTCHAKRHDNLLGNLPKRRDFAASPIDTTTPQENQRPETRRMVRKNEHFVRDFLQFSQLAT